MKRSSWGVIALALGLVCAARVEASGAQVFGVRASGAQVPGADVSGARLADDQVPSGQTSADEGAAEIESSDWLLNSLSESFEVAEGVTLRVEHPWGDVRVEAGTSDRLHVTALAQYHRDDPRAPSIRLSEGDSGPELVVEFAFGEIAEDPAWPKRRIDLGLLVPPGVAIDVRTDRGLIEVKKIEARSRLVSDRGDIVYDGTGSIDARSERGAVRALLRRTGGGRSAEISTLTGDIRCILLEGATADVTLETRGPVTTDYSLEIDRERGSPLKKGRIRLGEGGTPITLTSHSGGVRLQSLIAPEDDS